MKITLTVLLLLSTLAPAQTQKSETPTQNLISASFRTAAEDVLDCLDGLALVDVSPDQIYWPQSLKCRPMVRHLGRVAINPDETALAEALNALQSKITACHIAGSGGQPCAEERAVRARAIQEGTLRAPASVGL
ncbi:MAG: hypothetical protein ACJ71W_16560 [Terriglobales bacterium]